MTQPRKRGAQIDISVIIAAYNAEKTLARAVETALAQQDVTVEVLVIDDCSPDATHAVAQAIAKNDSRVHVFRTDQNAGPAKARNIGLDAARGLFVTVLDSDDFMEPTRLAALHALAAGGDWDMVADDLWKVAEDDVSGPRTRLFSDTDLGLLSVTLESFVRGNMTDQHGGRGEMGFLKPLIAKDFLDRHALRYDETMRLGEDYALYADALVAKARFCVVDPKGYMAVVRPGSLSGHHDTSALAALVAADTRLLDTPGISQSERRALTQHRIDTMKRWAWMRMIDAVKSRQLGKIASAFIVPPPVFAHLLGQLGEQVVLRTKARFGARPRSQAATEENV